MAGSRAASRINYRVVGRPRRGFLPVAAEPHSVDRTSTDAAETVEAVDGVFLQQLAVGDETSVQHFRIEPGADVPEHSHHHEQAGFVYQGELTFLVDGEEIAVGTGDSYVLYGGEPHAAENRGNEPVRGLDIFAPPRADPDWLD
jgi:quercetin dioxygenase-like cupin family protein